MAEKLEMIVSAKDEFSATFSKMKSALVGVASAYVSFKTVAAGWNLFKTLGIDDVPFAKLEQNLGLSADLMSRLGFYADKSGGSIDDMSNAMRFMLKNTSEAAMGNEGMIKTLEQLGLSISSMSRMSSDEIFKSYLEALGKVGNSADRARLAMEVFGRGSAEMMGLLSQGAEGFKKISEEAERFGLVVSSQDAFNSKAFKQSMKLMELAILGIKKALVDELVPYLTAAFKTIAFWIADNRLKIVEWAKSFIMAMGGATEAIVKWGARAIDIYYAVGAAASKMAVNSKMSEIKTAFDDLATIAEKQKKVAAEIAQAETKGDNLNWVVYAEAKRKELVQLGEASEAVGNKIATLNSEYQQLVEVWQTDSSKMFNEAEAQKFFDTLKEGMDKWREAGTAEVPELKVQGMQTGLSDKIKSELDALQVAWSKYYMTERQQADVWRQQELVKFAGHKEALIKIEQIYQAKISEIGLAKYDEEQAYLKSLGGMYEEYRLKGEQHRVSEVDRLTLWYQEQLELYGQFQEAKAQLDNVYKENMMVAEKKDTQLRGEVLNEQLGTYADFLGGMAALSAQMGKKGFMLSKALNLGQAIMSTAAGAANALKDYAYPYNIIAAAAVIAFGMAQVAKIASQKPPQAKKGVDYVPADQTYQLHKGERVVPAETNKDLRAFLGSQGGGMTVGAVTLSFPNLNSVADLKSMSNREWQDIIEQKMIPNMRRLAGAGIKV
jgi:hypothetical protein